MALYGLYSGLNRHSVGIGTPASPAPCPSGFVIGGWGAKPGQISRRIILSYEPGIDNLLNRGQYFLADVFCDDN
jgi:hypothetical protein